MLFQAYEKITLPPHIETAIALATVDDADLYVRSQKAIRVTEPGWSQDPAATKCYITNTSFIAIHRDLGLNRAIVVEHHASSFQLDDITMLVQKHMRELVIHTRLD